MTKERKDWKAGDSLVCLSSSFEPAFTKGKSYTFLKFKDAFAIVETDNRGKDGNGLHFTHFEHPGD